MNYSEVKYLEVISSFSWVKRNWEDSNNYSARPSGLSAYSWLFHSFSSYDCDERIAVPVTKLKVMKSLFWRILSVYILN